MLLWRKHRKALYEALYEIKSGNSISPKKPMDEPYLYAYQQHDTNTPLVISVLASIIEKNVTKNERIAKGTLLSNDVRLTTTTATSVFECEEVPEMTIESYMKRALRYTRVGESVYVVAYVYVDRLCKLHPQFRISPRNVHNLLLTAIMVASKYVEDKNSYFVRVEGLTTMEMNKLELLLLS